MIASASQPPPTASPAITKIDDSGSVWQFARGGSEIPEVEIIFFHGLQLGDFERAFWTTWLSRDGKEIWPKDWLSYIFPNARILTVCYDSSATKSPGQQGMDYLGENLVNDIIFSSTNIGQKCPVVLVGHSLGGLVIKQFIKSSIYFKRAHQDSQVAIDKINTFLGNVRGVFYYATPHQGSEIANLAGGIPGTSPILSLLKTLSTESLRINEDFLKLRANFNVKAFVIAESRRTRYKSFHLQVVREKSARQDDAGFYTATHANHFDVCKPKNKMSETFTFLCDFVEHVRIVDKDLQIKRLPKFHDSHEISMSNWGSPLEKLHTLSTPRLDNVGDSFVQEHNGVPLQQESRSSTHPLSKNFLLQHGSTSSPKEIESTRLDGVATGTEVDNSITYSPRGVCLLRRDIHDMGFTSLGDKFNPHRVLFLYDVVVSIETETVIVEMVFFHIEGMASLFGIGLPFSKVSIGPKFKIVIEEMSESDWNNIWRESYKGPFKPMIFDNFVENVTSSSSSSTLCYSPNRALSEFGVAMEGKNYCKRLPKASAGANKDTSQSNASNFGIGWTSWFNGLWKNLASDQGSTRGMKINDVGAQNGGQSTTPSTESKLETALDKKKEVETNDRQSLVVETALDKKKEVETNDLQSLVVEVIMNAKHSKFYENKWVDPYDIDSKPDPILSECFVKPTMTIEFLCNGFPNIIEESKRVEVKLDVEYQLNSNLEDDDKFGWYHKALELSFHCKNPGENPVAATIDGHEILSPMKTSDLESTINTGTSRSSSRGRHSDFSAKGGARLGGFVEAGAKKGSTNESSEGESSFRQDVQKTEIRCLEHAQSFAVTNVCSNNTLAYKAKLTWYADGSHFWNPSERHKAELIAGMFSTINVNVKGSWKLHGTEYKTYVLQADKMLRQHRRGTHDAQESSDRTSWLRAWARKLKLGRTRESQHPPANSDVKGPSDHTLWQIYKREFILNHSFFQFHTLKNSMPHEGYTWRLDGGLEACPIAPLLTLTSGARERLQ